MRQKFNEPYLKIMRTRVNNMLLLWLDNEKKQKKFTNIKGENVKQKESQS